MKLPATFRDFLSIHNSQSWTHLKLFDGDRLLSIQDIIDEWEGWKSVLPEIDFQCREAFGEPAKSSPEQGIKDDWWNHSWVPMTSNGSGDSYCIDLDPSPQGRTGQVIRMWYDLPDRELIATSFVNWINKYVDDLENGIYKAADDIGWGGIVVEE